MTRPLSRRHARFVAEYLVDLNATQAAIRAGYAPSTARVLGSRVLQRPDVRAAVEASMEIRAAALSVEAADVVRELAAIGFSDITDVMPGESVNGSGWRVVDNPKSLPRRVRAAVSSLKITTRRLPNGSEEQAVSVRLWDKQPALAALAKHLGMLVDRAWSQDEVQGMLARVAEILRREVSDPVVLERIEQAWKREQRARTPDLEPPDPQSVRVTMAVPSPTPRWEALARRRPEPEDD